MSNVNNINAMPDIGYVNGKQKNVVEIYKNDSHIHKQGILSGLKAEVSKYENDILSYFPKGFAGSKNSDFYEFLSLGKIPNIIGSILLIGLYSFANKDYGGKGVANANKNAKVFGAGVVLYALLKWASKKIAHVGIKASTGVDLDQGYIDKKVELPEFGKDTGVVTTKYRKVLESTEFPRTDLLQQKGLIEHDDQDAEYKKIAEKNGWGKNINAVNQIIIPKMRQLKTRATALENITSYIAAATGVALGSQVSFEELKYNIKKANFGELKTRGKSIGEKIKSTNIPSNIKNTCKNIGQVLGNGVKQLWEGSDKNIITKHYGKVLLIGTAATTLLTWLVPTLGFKKVPNTVKAKVDNTKQYEVG